MIFLLVLHILQSGRAIAGCFEAGRPMQLHCAVQLALQVLQICEVTVHKIVHYALALIHAKVKQNIRLEVVFIAL